MISLITLLSTNVVSIICILLSYIATWQIFSKAGEKGWKSLIPYYSTYVLGKIAIDNGWILFIFLIPLYTINIVDCITHGFVSYIIYNNGLIFILFWIYIALAFGVTVWVYCKLSYSFGHGTAFGWGLALLGPITTLILAFDSSTYKGPLQEDPKSYSGSGYF